MSMKPITLENLTRAFNKARDYFVQIKDAILTVNNTTPDEYGNVQINRVNYAGDLESSFTQTSAGAFIQRTSGGDSSISSGDAWLARILGVSNRIGYVAEVINMTVSPINENDPITATINEATFRSAMNSSGTLTLTYTTAWSADPATYGITVTGTPAAGDQITVEYVKEDRGTIYNSDPDTFVSTGWNLYDHTNGYAKVVHYSDEYGYRIQGTYTSLQFSTSLTGSRSAVTVTSGLFAVPSDGYIWVTGGDSSTTAIYPTWSDWTEEANGGTWAAYSKTEVDLSTIMSTYFPNGLFQVETSRDEINISLGQAISRIERMEYTVENLATAAGSGRAYTYDTDYIYLVRATPITNNITIDGSYTASDHGIEYFAGDEMETYAETIYGVNLKNKLERDVLTVSEHLANNLTTTASGKALDARQGKTLKDLVDTNTTVTSVTGAITWESSAVTAANCTANVYKMGKLRMVKLVIYIKSAISSFTKIGSVSSGNRPGTDVYSIATTISASGQQQDMIQFRANGDIRMSHAAASSSDSTSYYVTILYFAS